MTAFSGSRVVTGVWRTGRKVGRTVYFQHGTEPSDSDVLIGVMDSRSLAEEVVRSHNARFLRREEMVE